MLNLITWCYGSIRDVYPRWSKKQIGRLVDSLAVLRRHNYVISITIGAYTISGTLTILAKSILYLDTRLAYDKDTQV
ncbi:hypothetical protein BC937DRAFT_87599 [Endogone sp. FLAS-F59071]|nr:hypothetical protein BC937DRAFT_87599 [Endogone sp. FLAS-F59071]|eukprot:RUS19368.1 hypothetical protein BC937DRAFT_87599 [Endogone sp. FLAS-F59071]